MATQKISALVDGGKATPGPPLGPALGPLGVNVVNVIKMINDKTRAFDGMKVPVEVIVDAGTKEFDVVVGTPPTSALILKEVGAESGSGQPKQNKIGDISIESAAKVAKMKSDDLQGKDLKRKVKEVLGTCVSMGVTVEGRDPREVQKAIDGGEFDARIKE
ncbi:MAG TPA: 50S ribosomal protein L11 [Candidatus Thermoplasmatota archaeon]|nr:50S ribosomal protein L11 [Candidatus Thermoplasmatota archaeon]